MKLLVLVLLGAWTVISWGEVRFYSVVNWDYPHREKLIGWLATREVVRASLQEVAPTLQTGLMLENPTPTQLRDFLRQLQLAPAEEIKIIYLAAHQSAAGEWDFPSRQLLSWNELLPKGEAPAVSNCFVIVDACYASALAELPAWKSFWAGSVLYAASGRQETFELNFTERRPVDFARRFPGEFRWLQEKQGVSWSRRLSFLGLMWTQAARGLPAGAEPLAWCRAVGQQAVENAARFKRERSERLASEIILR